MLSVNDSIEQLLQQDVIKASDIPDTLFLHISKVTNNDPFGYLFSEMDTVEPIVDDNVKSVVEELRSMGSDTLRTLLISISNK